MAQFLQRTGSSVPFAQINMRQRPTKGAVRTVLKALGREVTYGEYRKLDAEFDGRLDWSKMADGFELRDRGHEIYHALCHIIRQDGNICEIQGRPVVVLEEIAAQSEAEAVEILRKQSKQFVKWWLD